MITQTGDTYPAFLASKMPVDRPSGFEAGPIIAPLRDFQEAITRWAIRRGRAACWADTGLGKGPIQLEWCHQVATHTGKPSLIFAPLAVSRQFVREGQKFGHPVNLCFHGNGLKPGINVTNYERLGHFSPDDIGGVSCDESSILKGDGPLRQAVTDFALEVGYRLACSATPAPNDYMELGNHAEFLGVMKKSEMLSTFFIHDGGSTQNWRLKGHAQSEFWRWLCSWAVMINKPSDIGFSDEGYDLPPLNIVHHEVEAEIHVPGQLFDFRPKGLQERRQARRQSLDGRVAKAAELANSKDTPWLVWCDLNDESAMLAKSINTSIEVRGSDPAQYKENAVEWFLGKQCICNMPGFRAKLAAWKKNSPTSKNIIKRIEPKKLKPLAFGNKRTAKKGANTCGYMQKQTHLNLGERQSNRQNITLGAENNTLLTKILEKGHGVKPKSGSRPTLKKDLPKGLKSLVLPPMTTAAFYQSRGGVVQFAGQKKAEIPVPVDSTLTTAIIPGMLGGSSALPVTLGLVNSSTIPILLNAPQCICGGSSPAIHKKLISKPSIFGFGLNLQHCADMVFVGLSDSYEAMYQAIRRCWRFGQTRPVNVHIVTATTEGDVVANIRRKEADALRMRQEMVKHMADITKEELGTSRKDEAAYSRDISTGDGWAIHLGDCVEVSREIADESIAFTIFSPPYASLYTYSNSIRDMGNSNNDSTFSRHFIYLVRELFRVTMPGRIVAVDCMDLPAMKERDGYIGLKDFRGQMIRSFQRNGFIFHSSHCIWKDPLIEATRTKALGLMHKQLCKDSTMCRAGIPQYLLAFRKPGANPEPVSHANGLEEFYGEHGPAGGVLSHERWRRYASPIWTDINFGNTLNAINARHENDERHICPMSLDIIARGMHLWSNPGELVLDPFNGVGSTGYQAVKMGRRYVGIELKESYWREAIRNLQSAQNATMPLFYGAA